MLKVDCNYNVKEALELIMEVENFNILELSEELGISRISIEEIIKTNKAQNYILEKIYSYIYKRNLRINNVKNELYKEKYQNILFHGSKNGLDNVSILKSRNNCDFGNGFYLGENYNQALSFVSEKENSSIYCFKFNLENLKIKKFECNLEWMLAICYFRGTIDKYANKELIKKIIDDVNNSDVIIAPIADNRMFYIMSLFTDGEINADVALHSLSASSLGFQYVFKTEKSLNNLIPLEKLYISNCEREKWKNILNERALEIDTKLKLAKREFKNGLYIEEILK